MMCRGRGGVGGTKALSEGRKYASEPLATNTVMLQLSIRVLCFPGISGLSSGLSEGRSWLDAEVHQGTDPRK